MSVIAGFQVNGAVGVSVGGTGTAIKYFGNVPGAAGFLSGNANVNAAVSSNNLPNTPSSTSNAGGLQVPGFAELNGQQFRARASGNILFGAGEASTTGKVGMYLSNALPSASPSYQTLIELTLTNQAQDGVYYPWALQMDMEGDTLSGILQLVKSGGINGTITTATQVSALTGISFSADPAFTLVVGVTFGASNDGNLANMYQFQISLP